MKGENEMTFNPGYAEFLGKELQRNRMHEAEKERLIRKATAWEPSLWRKLSVILHRRWEYLGARSERREKYLPVSHLPKNSHSL